MPVNDDGVVFGAVCPRVAVRKGTFAVVPTKELRVSIVMHLAAIMLVANIQ